MKTNDYRQLCVWPATTLGDSSVKDFEKFFADMGVKVKYAEEVVTLPDRGRYNKIIEGTGGRHDIFFYVHTEDVMKFAILRLQYGIRWWEDILGNGHGKIYPKEILKKYPNTWEEVA